MSKPLSWWVTPKRDLSCTPVTQCALLWLVAALLVGLCVPPATFADDLQPTPTVEGTDSGSSSSGESSTIPTAVGEEDGDSSGDSAAPEAGESGKKASDPPEKKEAPDPIAEQEAQPATAPSTEPAPVQMAQTDVKPTTPEGPNAPGQKPGAGPPGAPPAGPPPLPVLLGFAEFMLILDRPYEAEKIYRGILQFDPNNQAALAGLRDVALAKRPTFQGLTHYYVDTHDVELYTYGGGPTFRTPWGRVTVTAGTGHYRNNNDVNNERNPLVLTPLVPSGEDNDTLRKSTLNLILEPYYKRWEGNFLLSRVTYDAAPDRTLFDFRVAYVKDPRTRYALSYGRHDSFYQSQAQQFFAPENYFMLVRGITYNDIGASIEYPVTPRLDFGSFGRYFQYSDGNERYNVRTYLFYRIKGDQRQPLPIFRAGLDVILDDSKFFTLDYSASAHFNAYSLAADYVWLSRRTKYIIYGSYPVGKENFDPPAALILSYRRKVSRTGEFYVNINGFLSPGISISFGDYVLGFHKSF